MKTSEPPTPHAASASSETKPADANGSNPAEPLPIMTRHRNIFEKAHSHLEKTLGKSPPPEDLMRLWLATATPWDVARVFESAVLDLGGSDMMPLPGEDYNQSLLAL